MNASKTTQNQKQRRKEKRLKKKMDGLEPISGKKTKRRSLSKREWSR